MSVVVDGVRAWAIDVLVAVVKLFMVIIEPLLRYIVFCVRAWQADDIRVAVLASSPVILAAVLVVALNIHNGVRWWNSRKK